MDCRRGSFFAVLLTTAFSVQGAGDIELSVSVVSKAIPAEVAVRNEDSAGVLHLQRNPSDGIYRIDIPRPTSAALADAKKLSLPYRLVATWGDGKEQFYLGFQSRLPEQIDVKVYRNQLSFDWKALTDIERLGSDYESLLEKYCRSRAYHMHWRYSKSQPTHAVSIRSARLWFDAAVGLANKTNSPFRMDEDVTKIFEEYERLAEKDSGFRDRYRRYAQKNYVTAMLEEVAAAQYAFVGTIPTLVAAKRFDEAMALNSKAISALSIQDDTTKAIVLRRQGVNLDLLQNNAAYISQMVRN